MDDAQALEDRGAPDGSLVQAGFQTAGRGRHAGRLWQADAGRQLLFTIFWRADRFRRPEFAPSLVVGLGLCLWLEALVPGAPVALKWPNDLYLGDRKAAGILVRRRVTASGAGTVHAGLGVNLLPPSDPAGFRTPPASLSDLGLTLDPEAALESLLPALARALDEPDPRSACEARLWRRGQRWELSVPGREGPGLDGVVRGLDPEGRLWFEGPRGLEAIRSGE